MEISKTKEELIINIGSANVSGAILSEPKKGVPEISFVKRVQIGSGTKETKEALPSRMKEALSTLLKEYKGHKVKVRVVLSSPWHTSHVRVVSSTSKKVVNISEKTVEKTILKYKDEKPPESGNVDVEAVAVQVSVNGYPTALQHPVLGSNMRINLYESEMDKKTYSLISETIGKEFPHANVTFNTLPLISGVAIREIAREQSFVYLDIGGEITDLSVVYGDGIYYLATFPIGYLSILREIGGEQIGDASSRLLLLAKGELSVDEEANLSPQFEKAFSNWKLSFEKALKASSEKIPIPRTIFLMSDKEPLNWMAKGLKDKNDMQIKPFPITPTFVQNHVSVGNEGVFDVFLSLSALFFHIEKGELLGEEDAKRVVYSRQ